MARPRQQKLARFLRQKESELGSQRAIAAATGLSPATIHRGIRGCLPTAETYHRLQAAFPGEVPELERTETDRRSEQAKRNLERYGDLAHTPAAKRKAAVGKRRPKPKQSQAMMAYWEAAKQRGIRPKAADRLTEYVQTPAGRVRVSLGQVLRSTPNPIAADLDAWAERTAARLGLTPESVMQIAKPVLRDRGLIREGRLPLEDRHALVDGLIARVVRGPGGRLPRGFWSSAARKVREDEGSEIDGTGLGKWYYEHVRVCDAPAGDVSRRRARQQVRVEREAAERKQRRAAQEAEKARWVTSGEVAFILGVHIETVKRWNEDGRLQSVRTPYGRRLFDRDVVLALRGALKTERCSTIMPSGTRCKGWARPDDSDGRCAAHAKPAAACGTPSGYNAHRDRGERPCDLCKQAAARYQRDRKSRRDAGDSTDRRKRAA